MMSPNPFKRGDKNPKYTHGGIVMRVCLTCLNLFNAGYSHKTRKYCSKPCASKHPSALAQLAKARTKIGTKPKKEKPPKPPNMICTQCGAGFFDRKQKQKFCSYSCKYQADRDGPKPCVLCGTAHTLKRKTCSEECKKKWRALKQKGEKSHRWQGGKTSEVMLVRNSIEYSEWRKSVFHRDGYQCKSCGVVGGVLHADHIKAFSLYPELRLDINNGRTLCVDCHRKTDSWGYRAVYMQREAIA